MRKEATIPVVLQVRKQSERCVAKNLRDFYQGETLVDIACKKFAGDKNFIVAGHEDDFEAIAKRHDVGFHRRTKESAYANDVKTILSYLEDLPYEHICVINSCTPFLTSATVQNAISKFKSIASDTLLPVIPVKDVIFDQDKRPVNHDATLFDSKARASYYTLAASFVIYSRLSVLNSPEGRYFDSYKPDDPYLYAISPEEAVDIDTELQFEVVQAMYASKAQRASV